MLSLLPQPQQQQQLLLLLLLPRPPKLSSAVNVLLGRKLILPALNSNHHLKPALHLTSGTTNGLVAIGKTNIYQKQLRPDDAMSILTRATRGPIRLLDLTFVSSLQKVSAHEDTSANIYTVYQAYMIYLTRTWTASDATSTATIETTWAESAASCDRTVRCT